MVQYSGTDCSILNLLELSKNHILTTLLAQWRPTGRLRVAGSIPRRNIYLYHLQIVVPGLAVCVCEFSVFVNAPTIQELFLE